MVHTAKQGATCFKGFPELVITYELREPPSLKNPHGLIQGDVMEEFDDGTPVSVEIRKGHRPRVVFRRCPNHRHDETWQSRRVRSAPVAPNTLCGPLAYYNNSKTAANSNVLQVILRDHGYERFETVDQPWSIFWCAGQVDPLELRSFTEYQKVNKFPRASALTLKSNLWSCFARMLAKHGPAHYGFMPQTFVIPSQLQVCLLLTPGRSRVFWLPLILC